MKVKDTLNLGKTKFPMRGNLPVREVERQNEWEENKVYEQRQKLNEGKPSFVLHDGPPYANGNIHMGHAMNKISKDFIVRSKSMMGFRAPYVPGWDTHGLPIEQQLKKAGVDRKALSVAEFREMCRQYALEQVDKQRKDFKRLGVAGEWDNPYLTLKPEYEAQQIRVFGKMAEKGLIYKGKKPVFWSWSSESALAEAEVEYHDVTSPSAFYGEQVVDGKGVLDKNTYMVVWTTTPWTIPASEGITIDATFDYAVVQHDDDERKYVLAADLVNADAELFGWNDVKIVKTVKGAELENVLCQHPFYPERKLVTMLGDFVTTDAGTGLVHTAPGFGEDDFNIGVKYGLDVYVPVDDKGYMTEDTGEDFAGLFYEDANEVSLKKLEEAGVLLKQMDYEHSYPFDWRTKKPIIFRATPQWFASVDKIRDQILGAINEVQFFPDWGQKRLYNMIRDRGDWVISRQRVWGVPLPIFYGEDGEAIMTKETIEHVAKLVEEHGSNIWFQREAKDLLPEGFTSEHSPNGKFTKETDIMDVWFDSGSSHQGVCAERDYLTYPADLYLEGSDQYRGWFNSSLITSVAYSGHAPYKQILSQGFTLDGKGRKMSKSLGNTIVPSEVIDKMGAEIIRLWVLSVDTSADVRVSMGSFQQIAESYRKFRNTVRFLLANTTDFDPAKDAVAFDEMESIDKYMTVLVNKFTKEILDAYANYEFMEIYKKLINFITTDLSAFYMDVAKDVVYIEAPDSKKRRSMQTVLYDVVVRLTKLMTPILPHTTEEIWKYLKEDEKYAQLSEMPEVKHFNNEEKLVDLWNRFMNLRSGVFKALEEARNEKLIGKSFEAHVDLYVSNGVQADLDALNANVRQALIVSALDVHPLSEAPENALKFNDEYAVVVEHAEGEVCPRCRMIKTDIGSDADLSTLCASCAEIVRENYPEALAEGLE
ncbi:isoleucine--tRNA ligase [Lactobacillus salivarius]|uniref:Isoleucine--tRNA ligase n=1 Tax=Ligilactobacillus salivarius TaxID=1624 RepID=A0A1V9S967_9LACO|nr:isoleucine--tRNA ligase [Ligilactobacillus salivarius]HBU67288.1 isoleucine--tRNA ligase [Lactobacillus sp.]ADJ79137.1 Isoleucyl-tRNA synthetase(Isoleucine--tRNA ligase) (IleRS) [Ligilactobacillus salivarius CECT 5713]ARU19181.1 isoleucine--tRNA ligase [Ligilactobacillus salivarius]MBE7387291.1 isoleucine--tRNA ligase [Ligilactobacillus salivarius]MBE7391719.1 isoleucine--tRNA ligase [Ligilactobacillus salivarius]